jgi:hypothetical protein
VPVFVQVIFAEFVAVKLGVSIIVSFTPLVVVAPVVTLITPFVTDVTAVMFLVTSMTGMPLEPASQPVNVPKSA